MAIPDEGINFTSVVSQLERELIVRCLEKTASERHDRGTALADALLSYLGASEEPAAAHRGALLSRIRTPSLRA